MASCGPKTAEGTEKVGESDVGHEQGGGGCPDLTSDILAVVQLVLLYRSEVWVMTLLIRRVLGGFHHRVACRLTEGQPRTGRDGVWIYPQREDAMTEAGLQEV